MARFSLFSLRQRQPSRSKAEIRIAQLRAMSAAELADIGVKPGDLPSIERRIRSGV